MQSYNAPASTDGHIPTSEAAKTYLSEIIQRLMALIHSYQVQQLMSFPSDATIAAGPSHGSVKNAWY